MDLIEADMTSASWNLSDTTFTKALDWLKSAPQFAPSSKINILLFKSFALRWKGDHPETGDSFLSVFLGTMPLLQTMLSFGSIQQYFAVRKGFIDHGIVHLSDKHVKPQSALPSLH